MIERTVPSFDGIRSLLREAGARVIGIDMRGHGRSGRSADPERHRGDVHARDVACVLDALDDAEVDLIGYSMGTFTAARLLATETRLRSAVLCGTGPWILRGNEDELLGGRRSSVGVFRRTSGLTIPS